MKKKIITDSMGQWKHPGEVTRIPSNQITMKGVPYPVWAQPNVGPGTLMQPGGEYNFPNADYVDEYPQMKKGGLLENSNIFATNRLFVKNKLFKKRKKKRAPGVYNPNAKFKYEDGGENKTKLTKEEEQAFQKFYITLPENLQTDDDTYDIRGYWDGLGRPAEFDYSQPKEDDGYYHAFSINPNTGEYLKSPAHETFQHAVDEDRKIGYRPLTNVYGRNIATENESIANPEEQSFLRNTEGPANYIELDLSEKDIDKYVKGGYIVEEVSDPSIAKLNRFIGGGALEKLKPGGANKGCPPGTYWNGTKCTKLYTLKHDKKYIDGVANWAMHVDNNDVRKGITSAYNDQIKNRLYSGNYGFDPESGSLIRLDKIQPQSVTKVDDKTKASRAKEKLTEQHHYAEEENKKAYEKSIIDAGFDPATFGKAKGTNVITGEPIYASSKEEADRINQEAINQAAIEGHAAVVNNPVFKTAANFTPVGMAVGAIEGLARFIPDAVTLAQNPSWAAAGQLGIDALQAAPIIGKPIATAANKTFDYVKNMEPVAPGPMMLLGRTGSTNMVKKNMNYYKQLLDSYDGKKMSAANRKFYNDLIKTANKQDGMVSEAQLRELDKLKTGNFDFGKRGYNKESLTQVEPKAPVETPKSDFKSEIDWDKWNPEISKNPELLQEYNAIEEAAKADGTWMKNPDGSPFVLPDGKAGQHWTFTKGTPEQFVQMQSQNFKKAYPEGFDAWYTGRMKDPTEQFPLFAELYPEGRSIFGGDYHVATRYASTQPEGYDTFKRLTTEFKPKEITKFTDADQTAKAHGLISPKTSNSFLFNARKQGWREIPVGSDTGIIPMWEGQPIENFRESLKTTFKNPKTGIDEKGYKVKSDDIAEHLEKNNMDYATIEDVVDGSVADYVRIHNLKSGNYPKSLWGNNGMFDLSNPNIYKAIIPTVGVTGLTGLMMDNSNRLQQQKKGGVTNEYIELDIPEEEIQKYIAQGYIVEPVSKLKKFIS